MMEKIDIKNAVKYLDVIESIRANMPTAEFNKKGLADNSLIKASQLTNFALKLGESATVGAISGLCVIRHAYSNSQPAIVYIDNFAKSIVQIAGRSYTEIPMEIEWEGTLYDTNLIIKSRYLNSDVTTIFAFVVQRLT